MNIDFYKQFIKNTIISIRNNKKLSIINTNDENICIKALDTLFKQCIEIELENIPIKPKLQNIHNDLLVLSKSYGTLYINDLLLLLFNKTYVANQENYIKYLALKQYTHPISYKVYPMINKKTNKYLSKVTLIDDNMIADHGTHLECFDLARTTLKFYLRVNGLKLSFHNNITNQIIIVNCIVDDMYINNLDYEYFNYYNTIFNTSCNILNNFIESLTIKDKFIYNKDEIKYKYDGLLTSYKLLQSKPLTDVVKDFINSDLYTQRSILIKLLISNENIEHQYSLFII